MNGIKIIYVNSLACVRVKGSESKGCIISPWFFSERSEEVVENGNGEEGREWGLPGFLYADDLVLCSESVEDLRAMVGRFAEVCRRRGLKVNVGKSKVLELGGKEELGCEVCVGEIHLRHVSEFKYLGCVLEESGTGEAVL